MPRQAHRILLALLPSAFLFGCGGGQTGGVTPTPSLTPPSITAQPADGNTPIGLQTRFTVGVTGSTPITFQWFRNGAPLAGATDTAYTTPVLTAADNNAVFTVTATNAAGSATSRAATLTVTARAPKPGDLRFNQVDSENTVNGYVGYMATDVNGRMGQLFAGATGTPFQLTNGDCVTPQTAGYQPGYACSFFFSTSYQPVGVTPLAFGYFSDFCEQFPADLSAGYFTGSGLGTGPLTTSATVINSLALAPSVDTCAASFVQTAASPGGFSGLQYTVPVANFPAAAASEAAAGRVITALSQSAGNITFYSYAWTGDSSTYDATVVNATYSNAAAVFTSLAQTGYILTALGNDPTDATQPLTFVGTRVHGDTLPRPFLIATSGADAASLLNSGYAQVGLLWDVLNPAATNRIWLGER